MVNEIHAWHGKPIEELTRDQLLEVVRYVGGNLAEITTPENIKAMAFGRAELMRRGCLSGRTTQPEA